MAPMSADWFRLAPTERLERLEARFQGHAFTPHRHDTYAIGRACKAFITAEATATACPAP